MDDVSLKLVIFGASTSAPRENVVVFSTLLEHDLPAHHVPALVINSGVPGHSSEQGRMRFHRDVLRHHPHIVTLQFGLNDSAVDTWRGATQPRVPLEIFKRNLRFFIHEIRAHDAEPIVLLPQPIQWTAAMKQLYTQPTYDHSHPEGWIHRSRDFHDAARHIADELGVARVELDEPFRAWTHTHNGTLQDLFTDGMHPNSAGHRIIADQLLPPILKLAPRFLPALQSAAR